MILIADLVVPNPAPRDPLELALLAVLALAYIVQIILRRKNGHAPSGFTAETAGQIKEQVKHLEREIDRILEDVKALRSRRG